MCPALVLIGRKREREPLMSMPISEFRFEVVVIDPFKLDGVNYISCGC